MCKDKAEGSEALKKNVVPKKLVHEMRDKGVC